MLKSTVALIAVLSMSNASVEIYQDRVKLSYIPLNGFIGFNKNIKASSLTGDIKVTGGNCAYSKLEACLSINKITELSSKNLSLSKQKSILEQTLNELCIDSKEANKTIAYIKTLSDKISQINMEISNNNYLIGKEEQKRVLPSTTPYYIDETQKGKIDVEFSGISFGSRYMLNIDDKTLKHVIKIKNLSGIDISKTDATIFDRRLSGIAPNEKFRPMLIRVGQPIFQARAKASYAEVMNEMDSVAQSAPQYAARKESTKKYKINDFSLISDGVSREFVVDTKGINIKKSLIWNAWQSKVYESAELELGEVFESRAVDLVYNRSMIKNAPVRKDGDKLVLNIAEEYDVEVSREEIPNFSKDKGLFNSDVLIEKGYKLSITNLSKHKKKFSIVEKLPVPTDEKIEVVLKGFWSLKDKSRSVVKIGHDEKLGKLELEVILNTGEKKVYEYEFSIRHPKEMPIRY